MEKKTALVVGGTSGLGLQLALQLAETHQVIVTGHNRPEDRRLDFRELHLSGSRDAREDLHEMVSQLPFIDLLIYSAGFLEEGTLTDMDEEGMDLLLYTGLGSPALLLRDLLRKQDRLPGFIAITSTAQWTPRRLESMYTAVKAGLAMFAQSISLDGRVEKTMVAGPGGMNTPFWSKSKRDASAMLGSQVGRGADSQGVLGDVCVQVHQDSSGSGAGGSDRNEVGSLVGLAAFTAL